MATKEQYITSIRVKVREANKSINNDMGEADYEEHLSAALRRYSKDRPKKIVTEITGASTRYYLINATNFPDFIEGFSVLTKVEAISADVSNEESPRYISGDAYEFYRDSAGYKLHFKHDEPTSSDTIRIEYTVKHTINGLSGETVDTIPNIHYDAVIYAAAYEACRALAGKYSGSSDPTIRSDVVNYRTKSREYLSLAKDYLESYYEWISDKDKPASSTLSLGYYGFNESSPYLTHINQI